jgi:predicted PurR-regulated permease PerM
MGIPAAGLWTVGVMILAIVQLPPILLLGPICIWVFSSGNWGTTPAVLFTIWSFLVSGADGLLKPLFLGRGLEIPMPVILIGAIGGMLSMGIIGLFLGAVVLSIGYSLFMAWLGLEHEAADDPGEPDPTLPEQG